MGFDNFAKIISQLEQAKSEADKLDGYQDTFGAVEWPIPKFTIKVTKVSPPSQVAKLMDDVNALAIEYIKDDIKAALDAAMQSNIWGDGDDIIDTGELMNSLQITISGSKLTMDYSADYAAFVHYGGYIAPYGNDSIEKVYIPGRPWVDAVMQGNGAIEPVNLVAAYERAFQRVVG